MNYVKFMILLGFLFFDPFNTIATDKTHPGHRQVLSEDWLLKSSVLVPEDGTRISTVDFKPQQWIKTGIPTTVLNALVKNGIYPDPRTGLNAV